MDKMDLKKYGITGVTEIVYNPSYDELFREETKKGLRGYEKGQLTETGAVNVMTGVYTGRSPKDKFFVMDETTKDTIWWTSDEYKNDNKPVTKKAWKELKKIAVEELSGKKLFVVDTFCGANENSRLKIRFIMEVAWQAHFVKNMFIRPTDEELENYGEPDFVVLNASKAKVKNYKELGLNSETAVVFNLTEKMQVILNTWYGYPDIPLAQSPTPVLNDHAPDYTAAVCAMTREDGSPAFARSKTPEQIEDPVTLYRRTLAAQPDCSVTVLSLGFATELAKLLDSPADDISPLTGRELVARKVKTLSIMAGSYGEKQRAEFNVVNDIPAMRKLFAEWDTPIVQNPFELGKQVMYPGAAIENDFGWAKLHPVVEGYKNYHKMPYDRASWDLLSVVYLLHPEYFTESEPGTVAVDDKGFTNFTPGPDGRHRWLTATPEQLTRLRDCIVRTTTRAPKHTEL